MIKTNQNAFFQTTISLNISDTQIKKHLRDTRLRQLKDLRCSLYLRFNHARTGGTWWFYRYQDNEQIGYRVGKYPDISSKDIMKVVNHLASQVVMNKPIHCHDLSMVDLVIDWHVRRETKNKTLSNERINNIRSMADRHLIGAFHGAKINELNHDYIDRQLISSLLEQRYSLSYIRSIFQLLKTAFSTARRLKKLSYNPMAEIKFTDFVSKSIDVKGSRLLPEHSMDLLNNIHYATPMGKTLCLLMVSHGSRIGETRKAQWQDISFAYSRWTIPKDNTKSKQQIVYPLTKEMVDYLKAYQSWQTDNGYFGKHVFPMNKQNKYPIHNVRASEEVKFIKGNWTAHDLRKLARTVWADLGIDYLVSETLLNHTKGKLDKAYIHSHIESRKIEALKTYQKWLKNCCNNYLLPVFTNE